MIDLKAYTAEAPDEAFHQKKRTTAASQKTKASASSSYAQPFSSIDESAQNHCSQMTNTSLLLESYSTIASCLSLASLGKTLDVSYTSCSVSTFQELRSDRSDFDQAFAKHIIFVDFSISWRYRLPYFHLCL